MENATAYAWRSAAVLQMLNPFLIHYRRAYNFGAEQNLQISINRRKLSHKVSTVLFLSSTKRSVNGKFSHELLLAAYKNTGELEETFGINRVGID